VIRHEHERVEGDAKVSSGPPQKFEELFEAGAQMLICINASPYNLGKRAIPEDLQNEGDDAGNQRKEKQWLFP
jgi:hypothetical protein